MIGTRIQLDSIRQTSFPLKTHCHRTPCLAERLQLKFDLCLADGRNFCPGKSSFNRLVQFFSISHQDKLTIR